MCRGAPPGPLTVTAAGPGLVGGLGRGTVVMFPCGDRVFERPGGLAVVGADAEDFADLLGGFLRAAGADGFTP